MLALGTELAFGVTVLTDDTEIDDRMHDLQQAALFAAGIETKHGLPHQRSLMGLVGLVESQVGRRPRPFSRCASWWNAATLPGTGGGPALTRQLHTAHPVLHPEAR